MYWETVDAFIDATLDKYHGFDPDDLTQVFMRGPFAGHSEREVYEWAKEMDKSRKRFPLSGEEES